MECEDTLLEMFIVSVSVGTPLKCADLVVDSFEGAAGNRIDVPVEHSLSMTFEGLGHRLQDANA